MRHLRLRKKEYVKKEGTEAFFAFEKVDTLSGVPVLAVFTTVYQQERRPSKAPGEEGHEGAV